MFARNQLIHRLSGEIQQLAFKKTIDKQRHFCFEVLFSGYYVVNQFSPMTSKISSEEPTLAIHHRKASCMFSSGGRKKNLYRILDMFKLCSKKWKFIMCISAFMSIYPSESKCHFPAAHFLSRLMNELISPRFSSI